MKQTEQVVTIKVVKLERSRKNTIMKIRPIGNWSYLENQKIPMCLFMHVKLYITAKIYPNFIWGLAPHIMYIPMYICNHCKDCKIRYSN